MGKVYEDAAVTLVAASGSDANHGLPGAPGHPNPSKVHPPITVDGCIVTEEAVPIDWEIQNSRWANRGWTFQEQFFSRRFLIFSPSQVSFECRCISFSPRFGFRGNERKTSLKTLRPAMKSLFSSLHGRNEVYGADSLRRYRALVAEYWPRLLSMEEDGINAFAAILVHLKDQWNAELHEPTMTFTAGMPHLIRQHAESPEPSLKLFVNGLTWYSKHPSRRREGFPSWCWAGWTSPGMQARLRWSSDDMSPDDMSPLLLVRNIFFRSSPDIDTSGVQWHQTTTPERVPIAEHDFPNVPEAVIFDAPVVYPGAVSWPEWRELPSLWGLHRVFWCLADTSLLIRDEFMNHIVNGEYCLLALIHEEEKRMDGASSSATFLIVRQVDQYRHERIGLAQLWGMDANEQLNRDSEIKTWELI
ncbi:hypothetical protein PFICI_00320 [Pestalotiopsis fici W106-1]|uniref:Heterokaryon incompatibility domain-containing protein n=1 Tax=Pestalotiopsis fici (strain W106-1 / CGMCC3.15140) TaxID=1229662 RepID=W3XLY2_PESFW|nr:uncharacterized protein PFICI_00320 [Pestalotiopsis fici W106-1]ETS86492.1 hypothetical protein PFICI_00320 [Pestalotiopsis fici W106-1]